jgi:hypothetical protein
LRHSFDKMKGMFDIPFTTNEHFFFNLAHTFIFSKFRSGGLIVRNW